MWKAAGLELYQRHQQASAGVMTATFEEEWVRPMKLTSFLGMAQSSSKVTQALHNAGWDNGIAKLTAMVERHMDGDGFVVLPYLSVLVCVLKQG